jgi:hypothetical protein
MCTKVMHINFLILLPTKNLESMCVLSARTMHSKKAVIYCKAQSAKHKHLIVLLLLHTLIPNA